MKNHQHISKLIADALERDALTFAPLGQACEILWLPITGSEQYQEAGR